MLKAEPATDKDLEKLYKMRQPSLRMDARKSDTDKGPSSHRTIVPRAYGETITQTGSWPGGKCAIGGFVRRKASNYSRVDHAKVCLSSAEFGTWVAAAQSRGSFQFRDIPPGTYSLKTTDAFGYKDTYYNPQDQPGDNPTFQLEEGERRWQIKLQVEADRPYRKIFGRVLDQDGNTITDSQGLQVSAWVQRPHGRWKAYYRRISLSGINRQDGTYLLDELDGRPVYVMVIDRNPPIKDNPYPPRFYPGTFSRNDATLITFGENESIENADIQLTREGGLALQGKVTDESTGQPVPEALVSIFHYDMFFDLFPAHTDEYGRYTIKGLGEGKFIVHVDARHRGLVKTRRYVTIEPCAKQTMLDFTLRPGATISGSLVDEQGNDWQIDRSDGLSYTEIPDRRRGEGASNFPYGSKYAPSYIKEQSTIFYEEGQGDNIYSKMVFPTKSSFLLPAVLPGKVKIEFYPRKRGQKLSRILYQGRDISETGLDAAPGQQIKDVKIVIAPR
jgi:protocatechuate 3,4-dioxygenase beta subunit